MEATIPFNGSGQFNRLYSWQVDAANNIDISSTRTDAELNGMAAGLTNCITRDGQSPPSQNIPWGGLRITGLGNAVASTDALNMATGDARYILSGAASVSLAGSLTVATSLNAATLVISGNSTLGGTLGVSGAATVAALTASGLITGNAGFSGTTLVLSGNFSGVHVDLSDNLSLDAWQKGLFLTDQQGGHPSLLVDASNNLTLAGTDASGSTHAIWFAGMHNSAPEFNISVPLVLNGSLTSSQPLNLTGALTPGSAASSVGYLGVPSVTKTANYQLALGDVGTAINMNGASLTLTIPANGSVAIPIDSVILITNLNASPLTIAITTDTLTISGTTSTGSRTLGQNGEARLRKVTATSWLITGTALT